MSIRIMSQVWEHSNAEGSELLLLLAIADYANNKGEAWPSITTLAEKCRLSRRQIIRMQQRLEERGELTIHRRTGFRGTNRYVIVIPTSDTGDTSGTGDADVTSDTGDTSTSDTDVTSLVTLVSPDPSRTIIQPSSIAGKEKRGLTEGQRFWLDSFGAKRFANNVQKSAVLTLEQKHGTEKLKQGVLWAAKQGMSMGRAVSSLETALPKWSGNSNGKKVIRVGG